MGFAMEMETHAHWRKEATCTRRTTGNVRFLILMRASYITSGAIIADGDRNEVPFTIARYPM